MMKRIVIFAALCGVMKLILAVLPESTVLASFCRVPAEVAAFFLPAFACIWYHTFKEEGHGEQS